MSTKAIVIRKVVPRLARDCGLPTAHSRIDIMQSKPVIVPAIDIEPKQLAKATPAHPSWLRRVLRAIVAWLRK